jgi:endonuclease/exonuclease/phosphatase (EEP) superfamily protein YafD
MRLILHLASLFVRGTALMLCMVGTVTGLACLAGMLSDQLDILTHAAPIWLVCGLAGLAMALIFSREGERRALASIAGVGVVAVLILMTPELLSTLHRPAKPPAAASTLKLVQFNLWAENRDPKATTAWILKQDADIVVTEEAAGDGSRPVVRDLAKAYPYRNTCRGRYGCDTRIFSRWPIVQNRDLYEDGRDLAGAWATIRHPRGDFTVVGAHFVWPIPAGKWQAQSALLANYLSPFPKDSLIVTGDFNATPWSWSLKRQDRALGLDRRTRALASWPAGRFARLFGAPFPILPIDQVYAGKAWKTVNVQRGPVLGSDHRPVVVTLAR